MRERDDNDKRVLKDGESLRVNVMLMDGVRREIAGATTSLRNFDGTPAGHKPGYVTTSDAERERRAALYAAHDAKVSSAWQQPAPSQADHSSKSGRSAQGDPPSRAANNDRAAAYAADDKRISEAWRS